MQVKSVIAGIDEAGRGALAGPVVAGACIVEVELFLRRSPFQIWSPYKRRRSADIAIADSKLLSPEERVIAYEWITANCCWGVGIVPASFIENDGILAATERAMQEAVAQLCRMMTPTYLLVDGRDAFWFDYPHSSIIEGDRKESSIAAASIIAKVTRDRLMCEEHMRFPQYGFAQHKGYGTPEHVENIRRHGVCAIHRPYFLTKVLTLSDGHGHTAPTAAGRRRKLGVIGAGLGRAQ